MIVPGNKDLAALARPEPRGSWSAPNGTHPISGSAARRHCRRVPIAARIQLRVYHDEDIEVYLNGVLATHQTGYVNAYELIDIPAAALETLKPSSALTIAVHCHQTGGGQGVDVSLVDVFEVAP